ncbi:MAG TPA: hypothetical protein VKW06_10625 [Candidatus Angelobacter sp.]|nr:hypothetical protein [Candidatus Angelobacter sp.]
MDESQQSFNDFMSVASLGTSTFLAAKAIDSPAPSTFALDKSGNLIASGGGAAPPLLGGGFGGSSMWILVGLVLGILLLVLHK